MHHVVEAFAVAIADEAYRRLVEFGQQGLSNISWALATLDSTRHEGAHRFMIAAAEKSIPGFRSFPPQAIAKFFWALGRLSNCRGTLAFFGAAVVGEGMERPDPFSWQDCSSKHTISMEIDTEHLQFESTQSNVVFKREYTWASQEQITATNPNRLIDPFHPRAAPGV